MLRRGTVANVTASGVWCEIPSLAPHHKFGPMEIGPFELTVGDRVLIGQVGGEVESLVIIAPMFMSYTEPDIEIPDPYTPPANSRFVYYFENEAARTVASMTLVSGLVTWLDDEQQLDIYTDEGTPGWATVKGYRGNEMYLPEGVKHGIGITSGAAATWHVARTNATDPVFRTQIPADTQPRFAVTAGGVISWSPGNAVADVTLQRDATSRVRLDGEMYARRASTANIAFSANATSDNNPRVAVLASGQIGWGPGNAATDTFLRRSTLAAELVTPSPFYAQQTVDVDGSFFNNGGGIFGTAGGEISGDFTFVDNLSVTGDLTVTGKRNKVFATKTADLSRTSTISRTNDDHLVNIPLGVGTWQIKCWFLMKGTDGDISIAWAFSGTMTGNKMVMGPSDTTELQDKNNAPGRWSGHGLTTPVTYGLNDAAASAVAIEQALITVTVAGNFSIQWAQQASTVNASTLVTGSSVVCERLA
jgi:hypothetical protein